MIYGEFADVDSTAAALDELGHIIQRAPQQTGITAQLALREVYERNYGIHEYGANDSPVDLMRLHPKENTSEWSTGYQRIRRFIWLEIYKETGMNLKDFFDMPREYTDLVFRIVADRSASKIREPDPLKDL